MKFLNQLWLNIKIQTILRLELQLALLKNRLIKK